MLFALATTRTVRQFSSMLRATRKVVCRRQPWSLQSSKISSTTSRYSLPNAPLNLDPSLQSLLRDINISLKNSKHSAARHNELEIVNGVDSSLHAISLKEWSSMKINDELGDEVREPPKSPAAIFGSNQIGSVILPQELRDAIESIISGNLPLWLS